MFSGMVDRPQMARFVTVGADLGRPPLRRLLAEGEARGVDGAIEQVIGSLRGFLVAQDEELSCVQRWLIRMPLKFTIFW